uniref:ORF76 n=1 Tax=Malaco herpesvirus 4 TaxID=3031800 RepID=A0AA48SF03_9VIRU|nr:TPA_asm: ORF76 [Malaco herpesvirus 4]
MGRLPNICFARCIVSTDDLAIFTKPTVADETYDAVNVMLGNNANCGATVTFSMWFLNYLVDGRSVVVDTFEQYFGVTYDVLKRRMESLAVECTGAIVLEAVRRDPITASDPIAIVYFTCNADTRDEILQSGQFTSSHLRDKQCTLKWITLKEYVISFDTTSGNNVYAHTLSWTALLAVATNKLNKLDTDFDNHCCVSTGFMILDTHQLIGELHNWYSKTLGYTAALAPFNVVRVLLFFHINLRYVACDRMIPCHFHSIMDAIMNRNRSDILATGVNGSMRVPLHSLHNMEKINGLDSARDMAGMSFHNGTRMQQYIHMYNENLSQVSSNCEMFMDTVVKSCRKARTNYSHAELFVSREIDRLTVEMSKTIPPNIFEHGAFKTWCQRITREVTSDLDMETRYDSVLKNLKCIEHGRVYYNLYQSMPHKLVHAKRCNIVRQNDNKTGDLHMFTQLPIVEGPVYEIQSGRLCTEHVEKNTVISFKHTKRLAGRADPVATGSAIFSEIVRKRRDTSVVIDNDLTCTTEGAVGIVPENTKQKLTQTNYFKSAANCTPIWMTQELSGSSRIIYTYHTLIPSRSADQRVALPLLNLLKNDMYVEHTGDIAFGTTSEMSNPGLHVSTIMLDVDLNSSTRIDLRDCSSFDLIETSVYLDLVDNSMKVLSMMGFESRDVTHYVFRTQKNSSVCNSVGLRHLIALPHTAVFTTIACSQLVAILNSQRHRYKDTLALFRGDSVNNHIYDTAIYGKNGGACHGLRGPYQCKVDGDGRLNLVFRSDMLIHSLSEHIPYRRRFMHGWHEDECGNHVLMGRVIEKIVDVELMEDEIYLNRVESNQTHAYVGNKCLTRALDIVNNIETHILFTPTKGGMNALELTEERLYLLVSFVNRLWAKQKVQCMNWMHANDFDDYDCLADTEFCLVEGQLKLCASHTRDPVLKFCLFRCHTRAVTGFYASIGLSSTSVSKLFILCKCFKKSCEGKRTAMHCNMNLMNVFKFPELYETFVGVHNTAKAQHVKNELRLYCIEHPVQENVSIMESIQTSTGNSKCVAPASYDKQSRLFPTPSSSNGHGAFNTGHLFVLKYMDKNVDIADYIGNDPVSETMALYACAVYDTSTHNYITAFRTTRQFYVVLSSCEPIKGGPSQNALSTQCNIKVYVCKDIKLLHAFLESGKHPVVSLELLLRLTATWNKEGHSLVTRQPVIMKEDVVNKRMKYIC